ncbi:MAG TPA: hypothetical protein VF705_14870 [Longimicrobium sp.]
MENAWGVKARSWYPMDGIERPGLLALHASAFDQALLAGGRLHAILAAHGAEHVFELREGGGAHLIELAGLEPVYMVEEGFWCSDAMDWLLYASHEDSITVGGSWLVSAVKAAWPEWERHVWRRSR